MNLRWKAFEQRLDQRVKCYDARLRMSFWQRVQLGHSVFFHVGWARLLPTAFLAAIALFNPRAIVSHPVGWVVSIGFWGLLVTIARAGSLWGAARLDSEYRLAWMLPLSAERIYDRLLVRVVWGGMFLFLDFLIIYGALASGLEHPTVAWAGALTCAALQAGFSLALTFLLVAMRINTAWLIMPLIALFFFSCLGFPWFLNTPLGWLFLQGLQTCNPLAWVNSLYWNGWIQGCTGAFWALLPVLLTFGVVPYSLRAVRRLHHQGAFRQIHAQRAGLFLTTEVEAAGAPVDLAAERRKILAGDFDQPVPLTEQGFVERLVARFLSPRERTLLEPVSMRPRLWSTALGDCLVYLVLFLVTMALVDSGAFKSFLKTFLSWDERWFLINVMLRASLVFGAALVIKSFLLWALGPMTLGLVTSRPPFLPVNRWQTAAASAKAITVLVLLMVPSMLFLAMSPFWQACCVHKPSMVSLPLKLLLLASALPLAFSSVACGGFYSNGWKHWLSYVKATLAFGLAYGLAIANLVSPQWWTDVLWAGAFILNVLVWFLYCGVRYRKGLPL